MTFRLQPLFLALLLALSGSAFGAELSLRGAKQQGLVGEQPDGYVGAVRSASPEVAALIKDINARRRAEYQRIAAQNQIALSDVAKVSGQKLINRTASGNYVRDAQGNWKKK